MNFSRKQRFSVRKLKMGAASVLVGVSVAAYGPYLVQAATAGDSELAVDGVTVIESGTTSSDVQHTVNGTVVLQTSGTPFEISDTDVASPLEGVRVYAQWFEKDGSASPVYTTTTASDGTYHIVMKDFVKSDGTTVSFDADPNLPEGETFRVWAETPDGVQLYYSWENSQVGPTGYVMDTSYNASNAVGLDQLNNFNFIYVPKTDTAVMHDMANASANTYVDGEQGFITGKVFWNSTVNKGAQTLGATATYNGTDAPARGVTVVASYLSDYALTRIYSDGLTAVGTTAIRGTGWTDANEAALQAWIKEQIAAEGTDKWIAETVTTTTDDNGKYTIQFNGTYGRAYNDAGYNDKVLLVSNLYSSTLLPDDVATTEGLTAGTSTYADLFNRVASSATQGTWYKNETDKNATSIDKSPKHVNLDWTYVSLVDLDSYGFTSPYFGNKFIFDKADTSWTNTFKNDTVTLQNITGADFALFLDEVLFDVETYDTVSTFATPGTTVTTNTQGLPSSDLGNNLYQIVWYDSDGNEVQASDVQIPTNTGTLASADFKVPDTAQDGDIYTAKLYSVDSSGNRSDNAMAIDAFKVRATTQADNYDPEGKDQTVEVGTTPSAEDSIANLDELPSGTTVAFKDPVDTSTTGEKEATVVVTYPDGSTDEVTVTITVVDSSTQADKNNSSSNAGNNNNGTKDAVVLPSTGERLSIGALILAGLAGIAGIFVFKKKEEKE